MELFRLSLGCICLLPWLEGALLPLRPLLSYLVKSGPCSNVERYEALLVNQKQDILKKVAVVGKKYRPSYPKQFANVFDQTSQAMPRNSRNFPSHTGITVAEGQGFLIRNTRLEKCIRASHETSSISLASCKEHSGQQQWGWDPDTGTVVSLHTKRCLSAHRARHNALVKLEPCGDWERQAWSCSKKGHLTLQSLGFHLGTKEGGHKVFVSREKDKFSRWKTLADETICAAARTAAQRPSKPTQQALDTRVWIYETKTIDSSKIDAVDRKSSVSLTDSPLANKFNSTVSPLRTKQAQLPANEDPSHNHSKKHGNRGKNAGARLAGTNWKTAMLVLSPLAFILGLIILTLNVHYNKKKKILSALKSSPANSSRADLREPAPLRRGAQPYLPPSRSPSLRRGEILIEWKDGTVTPLFDNINYQVD